MIRWLANILAIILVVALGVGLAWESRKQDDQASRQTDTQAALERIEKTIKVQAATGFAELNARRWPVTIEASWFHEPMPRNTLVAGPRPWIEVAPADQADLTHPPVRQTLDGTQAEFWYNPYNGIVRARVPVMLSDEQSVALYNAINGTRLNSIFQSEASVARAGAAPKTPAQTVAAPDADAGR